eukprot:TRINITY_DN17230_c0_g1_i1.p1 TRINITY_DN17230_c0_g1~~TRINITY_DN17230_c0_g1_i1.p1  ORF type:complete len:250 (-),score=40.15 TRINITY_DN17230_c0_g1_i1:16-765(-)
MAKVVTSAVVVVPPSSVWAPFQAVRELHDKAYERWMPHVNLLYPFVPFRSYAEAVPKLSQALRDEQPFDVCVDHLGYFCFGRSATVYAGPTSQPAGALERVQRKVEAAFPFCNDLSAKGGGTFKAHITLGQFPTQSVGACMAQLNWKPIRFTCSSVCVISRFGDNPFEVKYTVPFGGSPVSSEVISYDAHASHAARPVADCPPPSVRPQRVPKQDVQKPAATAAAGSWAAIAGARTPPGNSSRAHESND